LRWDVVDTHCHIDTASFDKDRQAVIDRACDAGVALVNSGIDLQSNRTTQKLLCQKNVYATYGLSPLKRSEASSVQQFIRQNADSAHAIGEVGLDFYHVGGELERANQEQVLGQFVELSHELNLPLVVHSRDAEERVYELVHNVDQVIYHCYGGSITLAKRISDCDHYVSISTRVCRSSHHQQLAATVPRELIVVETDSPYLSCRRGRNEPAFVVDALIAISKIWEEKIDETASIITNNTIKALNLA